MQTPSADAIRGCLWAGALGDASGGPYEGRTLAQLEQVTIHTGHITDDTQLTLATIEAIIEANSVDPSTIAARCLAWHQRGALTGLGGATLEAMRGLSVGGHWALVGRRGDHAAGNGAAMRVSPLALMLDLEDFGDRLKLRDVCRITHHHDEAYIAALALGLAIQQALNGALQAGSGWLEALTAQLPDSRLRDVLLQCQPYQDASIHTLAKLTGTSGRAEQSVCLAIVCAPALYERFDDNLSMLIRQGGDTDTIASMSAQIAGAALGYTQLPLKRLRALPEHDLIHEKIEAFVAWLK